MGNKTLECDKIQQYLSDHVLVTCPVYYWPPKQAPSGTFVIINEIWEYPYDVDKKWVIEVRVTGIETRKKLKDKMNIIVELLSSEYSSVRDFSWFKFYKCVEWKGPHPFIDWEYNVLIKEFIFYFTK